MSNPKLTDIISPENLAAVQRHMVGNGLFPIAVVLPDATLIAGSEGYVVEQQIYFPETESLVYAGFIIHDDNFMFWLKAETNGGPLGSYFPSIFRYNPWGVVDVGDYPFPNPGSAVTSDIKWRYLYFSTANKQQQQALYALLNEDFFSSTEDPLKTVAASMWNGGLFYSGNYKMPWAGIIPAYPIWNSLVEKVSSIPVNGGVFTNELLPQLKLRARLFSKENPFGENAVSHIGLGLELSAPLFSNDLPVNNHSVGLWGDIRFGQKAAISISGAWPLNDDDIVVNVSCTLSDIKSYLSESILADISMPDDIAVALAMHLSKETFSLNKIVVQLQLESWNIAGFCNLENVAFNISVSLPGSLNTTVASFTAKAKICESVQLACTGNYPGYDFDLGIDRGTSISLGKLINSISGVPGILPDGIIISELSGGYNSEYEFYSLTVKAVNNSDWAPGGFKLENISATIGKGENLNCSLKSAFKINYEGADRSVKSLHFDVEALYVGSWYFSAAYTGEVSLADIGVAFGFTDVPEFLNSCKFKALSLSFDSESGYKSLNGLVEVSVDNTKVDLQLYIDIFGTGQDAIVRFCGDLTLNIAGKAQQFRINFNKASGGYSLQFSLKLHIADTFIWLTAKSDNNQTQLSKRTFTGNASNLSLNLTDALYCLINSFTIEGFSNISNLLPISLPQLEINDLSCIYNLETGVVNITSSGLIGNDREISFVFCRDVNDEGGHNYAFGLLTNIGSLGGLPLVGDQLTDVKLNDFGFVYTSKEGSYLLNDVRKTLSKGFNLSGSFCFPGQEKAFPLELQPSPSAPKAFAEAAEPVPVEPAINPDKPEPAVNLEPAIKWYKLNKKLGPLSLGQLGFAYNDGCIGLYLQGSLAMASLSISLDGLGLTFAVNELFSGTVSPQFALRGIGLSYMAPPVSVSAAFLRSQETHEGKLLDVYSGTATIKASDFTITALGSYTQVGSHPSLFIYGLYEGALGGPAFFFVTGVAAGFGYNRRLNIPSVEEVASFPLVALAMNPEKKDPAEVLTLLGKPMKNNKKPLEISIGDYWLAVGIRFSSFKIIESFALLAVNFGTRLEFAVVGLSQIRWPEKSITPEPIVYLEVALVAHFGPDSDVISVLGVITPNSYVISKDCRITGGFAFYTWVSGPHEGDTVVTLGGYHPRFIKPAHYPVVPRLGLNWRISDNLTISGQMYYAITPSAIMAGGKWEVNFHLSFLSVNVTVWADMIISWSPYQYELEMGIVVKIDADIKILFVRIHFSLEMGAMLHIWGPDFAGEAHVDWAIFSFTIPFGSSAKTKPKSLDWEAFANGFIPQKSEKPHLHNDARPHKLRGGAAGEKKQITQPLNLAVGEGIISARENAFGQERFIIVNPQMMSVNIGSFIPSTHASFNSNEVPGDMIIKGADIKLTYASREKEIGIVPCGLAAADNVKIGLEVKVMLGGKEVNMRISGVTKGLPGALWGKKIPAGKTSDAPATVEVVRNALCGLVIEPPLPTLASWTKSLDFSKVFDLSEDVLSWQYKRPESGPNRFAEQVLSYEGTPETGGRKAGRMELSYMAGAGKRSEVLAMLKEHFDETLPEIEDAHMLHDFENGPHYFRAIPVLSGMGQVPNYSTQTAT
jgi:hypothetical protein